MTRFRQIYEAKNNKHYIPPSNRLDADDKAELNRQWKASKGEAKAILKDAGRSPSRRSWKKYGRWAKAEYGVKPDGTR